MYENKKQKLAPKKVYYQRIRKNLLLGLLIISIVLWIGILGYKVTIPKMGWGDSLLNASMILSGMGPVFDPNIPLSRFAKIFASAYALFSGVAFLSTFSFIIAPVAHRFLHRIHLEANDEFHE